MVNIHFVATAGRREMFAAWPRAVAVKRDRGYDGAAVLRITQWELRSHTPQEHV